MKPKNRADLILRQIAKRHVKELFLTEVKNGPTQWGEHRRMDAVAVKKSWAHPCITGYEVKVDRQDFLRDEKWSGYRDMCHHLLFACPEGLIHAEELPEDVGLIWYSPERQTIRTKRVAAFRDIEIPWQMLYYLVIARTDSHRHPFFGSRREYLEAWVEDKEESRWLGDHIGTKMAREISELHVQMRKLSNEESLIENAREELRTVKKILNKVGYKTGRWWLEELEEALKIGMPPNLSQNIEAIEDAVRRIKDAVGERAG